MGWSFQRAFLMMGYTIELMNQWLVDHAFTPLIAQTNASLQTAVTAAFVVALIVLGVTYLLAAFARMRVVEPKSAIGWYLAGALFFSLGPSLYQGMSDFRRDLAAAFYASSLSGLEDATGTAFSSLSSVDSGDLGLIGLCDNFGSYMPVWNHTLDGLDVALAYLRADGIDIMGYPSTPRDPYCQPHTPDPATGLWTAGVIPWEWERPGSYFDLMTSGQIYPILTDEQRAASIRMASAAQGRLLTAWPLILFGVAEQLVYLLLSIAQGLTFLSFGIAILFAFFRKTEVIARSIIDLWIELIVQTVVIALIQALVVTFFLAGTTSGNGIVVLGIGLLCLIFMVIVLFSGVRAVWNRSTGCSPPSVRRPAARSSAPARRPRCAACAAARWRGRRGPGGGLMGVTASAWRGAAPAGWGDPGAGGRVDLRRRAAGGRRGAGARLLPGVRGTALGDAAEQFAEGAPSRRVARDVPGSGRAAGPLLGATLLTDRDPEEAEVDDQGRLIGGRCSSRRSVQVWRAVTYPRGARRSGMNWMVIRVDRGRGWRADPRLQPAAAAADGHVHTDRAGVAHRSVRRMRNWPVSAQPTATTCAAKRWSST
ncbi:MAG: hypothetical protein IPK17_39020 [Chloroflexi bacterium]|uniref:hypothetical protein n=1 Tax=Candidatus Flexifilum breve TaxID=3140694 RepID=UPI00313690A0|nr:hypothetical protein [Chloroflexota bacterium]